jgi:thiosulfate dehydrogenase
MRELTYIVSIMAMACAALIAQGCNRGHTEKKQEPPATQVKNGKDPHDASVPDGPLGESIELGEQIFLNTPRFARAYVGNQLSCNDCHIEKGTAAYAAPLLGLPGIFPMYNQRAGRVVTLEDRIQECFTRSENGRPLPYRSAELIALVSYIQWLSRSIPAGQVPPGRGLVKLPELYGDATRGAAIYTSQCAICHGTDGKGEPPVLPPLWGPGAYNQGAGMNRVAKMAAFVQHNMPQNHPGSLTPQQAFDVSAFVASKPHPPFNAIYAAY